MKKEKSIGSVAKDLLSKHNGNMAKAVSALKKLFLSNPSLVEQYKDEIYERAASAIVQSVFASQRSSLFQTVTSLSKEVKTVPTLQKGTSGETQQTNVIDRVKASIKNETEALLNMALNVCKKQLRFATREDLAEEINMFLTHARGNDSRATFLTAVYNKLEYEQSVEDAFAEKDLAKIMKKTGTVIDRNWKERFVSDQTQKMSKAS